MRYTGDSSIYMSLIFKICQIILFSYNQNVDKSHIRANYSLMEYYIT